MENLKIDLKKYHLTLEELKCFYGMNDENIKALENTFKCIINANSETLNIALTLDNKDKIKKAIIKIIEKVKKNEDITQSDLMPSINSIENEDEEFDETEKFVTTYQGKNITSKNYSQSLYLKLLKKNTIVFAMGAAGTGKTYLAVAYAINLLKQKRINKIIITRPIVEAGENLGFLPGELKEKVDPYLTPIYDALNDIVGSETTQRYLDKQIVEIAPLAYMRGRTLSDAFIILDEAQNTTSTQMKMFLTRLGFNSKMVITGDESQIDLKQSIKSGIIVASEILKNIDDIAFITFDSKDVVRNPLVSKIIQAYEKKDN